MDEYIIINYLREIVGGWGEIRTHGGREASPVFKTGALNHSATHPSLIHWNRRDF